jgi:hypothetical protein
LSLYYANLDNFGEMLAELVHLDNRQLYHPFVQWLLSSQRSKEFLRKLHRGLEVGVKRGLESVNGAVGEDEEVRFANAVTVSTTLKGRGRVITKDKVLYFIAQETRQGAFRVVRGSE